MPGRSDVDIASGLCTYCCGFIIDFYNVLLLCVMLVGAWTYQS